MSYYIHQTPGRIRVRTPHIKNDEAMARRAETILNRFAGVSAVQISTVTGSITVVFNPNVCYPSDIINALNRHGFIEGVVGFPRPMPALRVIEGAKSETAPAQAAVSPLVNELMNHLAKVLLGIVVERTMGKTARSIVNAIL